jgi:isoaspartyl peptidase/L-asparaginase-like protein (Ntn-hydrolase superfamily)
VFENGLAKAKGSMVKIDGTTRLDAEIVDGAVRLVN